MGDVDIVAAARRAVRIGIVRRESIAADGAPKHNKILALVHFRCTLTARDDGLCTVIWRE